MLNLWSLQSLQYMVVQCSLNAGQLISEREKGFNCTIIIYPTMKKYKLKMKIFLFINAFLPDTITLPIQCKNLKPKNVMQSVKMDYQH